jgi:type IV pilus assembly protein PilY1
MNTRPSWRQRTMVHLVAWALVSGQFTPAAMAADPVGETDLTDVPLPTRGRAKPSMIFTVDDSASMDSEITMAARFSTNEGVAWWHTTARSFIGWGFNPTPRDPDPKTASTVLANGGEDVWRASATGPVFGAEGFFDTNPPNTVVNFNAAGSGNALWKQYNYLFPNGNCGGPCDTRTADDRVNDSFAVPPTREFGWLRSAHYNSQYYNPAVRYEVWRPFNDGAATVTPPSYDNGAASWTSVRSHPAFPVTGSPTTIDLTRPVPKPGDTTDANRIFILYSGMILPAGARFRCRGTDSKFVSCGGAADGSWADAKEDLCVVVLERQTATHCHYAGHYGVTRTLVLGGTRFAPNRVEAQIEYSPAVYWTFADGTGPLRDNESYGPDGRRLRRVEIGATGSFGKSFERIDCAGSVCSADEEMTNFANWFAYHRKRHMMLNGALGIAFDQVTGLRAGAYPFTATTDVTMYDFERTADNANKRRLLYDLYRIKGTGGTPTRPALYKTGLQFRRTGSTTDPLLHECQYNAALLITDGFARTDVPPESVGNADALATNRFTMPYSASEPGLNYRPDGTLPRPPDELPAASVTPSAPFADEEEDTLGDIAMHYYNRLLPTTQTDKRRVPVNINDDGPDADRNDQLHMNTFALTLGVIGEIFGRNDNPDVIAANANPYRIALWPKVRDRGGYVKSPRNIDELWHATVNGRGRMLPANSPEETRQGIVDIVNNVGAKGGAGAAVSVANTNITPGDNFSYASSYNSGAWSGDINKYELDPVTGEPSRTPLWSPSPQRILAVTPPDQRVIVTYNDAAAGARGVGTSFGVPFQWRSLSSDQQSFLTSTINGKTDPDPQLLEFLRGDRSLEVSRFRSRGPRPLRDAAGNFILTRSGYQYPGGRVPADISVLGDMVNAEPVVVRTPRFSYFDPGYQEFRDRVNGRTGMLYQGANDGMLHAFDLVTGQEQWAYVPSLVMPRLKNLADRSAFSHQFYVDGTPTTGDVDFTRTGSFDAANPGTPNWNTILVSGLGKGGTGYFALNVTEGTRGSESAVAERVLWEFPSRFTPSDPVVVDVRNIGYSYGKPLIVKTRAAGWVVIVTSGYNNGRGPRSTGGDGRGRLFVLNAATGQVLAQLDTQAGEPDIPAGLAHISAYSRRPNIDATIEAVYGGDLLGNVWRFDLSGTAIADWKVAKLAELRTSEGRVQPVTSEPELGAILGNRVVFIGTGRYLGDSDVPGPTSTSEEIERIRRPMTMYALRDKGDTGSPTSPAIPAPTRGTLVQQTATRTGTTITVTANPVDFRNQDGWYVDLPEAGERIVANPVLSGGVVTFITNIPDASDACAPGGSSWAYFLDFATGGTVRGASYAGTKLGTFLSSRAVLVRVRDGIVGLVRTSGGGTAGDPGQVKLPIPGNPNVLAGRRLSWREVPDDIDPR